ncbi:hypothetical protein ABZ714_18515 [Streptomyces sp. NPDC006798]|uniref:hypothetical protein n=1 Tax=Streptomyces sp. NPDC006798 TaxID=3155462 RepID=UPI00340FA339
MREADGERTGDGRAGRWSRRLRQPRPRTWIALALALIAVAAVGTTASGALERRDRLADNRAQLDRACRGLLPVERLRPYLPDGSRGRSAEYGTLLGTDPGQGTRALFDCRLSWGGGGPRGENGAEIMVRATAVGEPDQDTPALPRERGETFPLALPPSALGGSQLTGRWAAATLVFDCPTGITRHGGGRTNDIRVRAVLPRDRSADEGADDRDGPARDLADRRAAARTAVAVADWVAERAGCGGTGLGAADSDGLTPAADPALCRWLDPGALGIGGGWTADPGEPYATRTGVCAIGHPDGRRVEAVSGIGGWGTRLYGDPDGSNIRSADGSWKWRGETPRASVSASSLCDGAGPGKRAGVRAYHRVAVTPPRGTADAEGWRRIPRADADRLTETARRALARYLAASDGWPRRSGCRDTTTLPERAR